MCFLKYELKDTLFMNGRFDTCSPADELDAQIGSRFRGWKYETGYSGSNWNNLGTEFGFWRPRTLNPRHLKLDRSPATRMIAQRSFACRCRGSPLLSVRDKRQRPKCIRVSCIQTVFVSLLVLCYF